MSASPSIPPGPGEPVAPAARLSWLRRGMRPAGVCLLAGVVASVGVALALGYFLDLSSAPQRSLTESPDGEMRWTLTLMERWGGATVYSSREVALQWSSRQATGAPDTQGFGDRSTAWASATQDGQREWLILDYEKPVIPVTVRIYETYNPGAVDRITGWNAVGEEVELWRGADPTPPSSGGGVSAIGISPGFAVSRIRVHIDSPAVSGWNEIDAVGLVDGAGQEMWAKKAQASSSYAAGTAMAITVDPSMQRIARWSGLNKPSAEFETGTVKREDRVVEARGWPALALWCETTGSSSGAMSVPLVGSGFVMRGKFQPVAPVSAGSGGGGGVLPWRPIWSGLALDTLFWGVAIGALTWLALRPRRFIVEVARMRRGACIACGYDLNYDFPGGCPECGWRRDRPGRS